MKNAAMVLWLCVLLVLPGLAMADTASRPEAGSYPPKFSQGTWGCGLNLSLEQTEKMRDLEEGFLRETKDLRDQLKDRQAELRGLWNKRNPDQEKIMTTQSEIEGLEARIREKAQAYRSESKKVLTPEQEAQLGRFPRGYQGNVLAFGMMGELEKGRRTGTGYGSCPRL